jgi:hypothetical protein
MVVVVISLQKLGRLLMGARYGFGPKFGLEVDPNTDHWHFGFFSFSVLQPTAFSDCHFSAIVLCILRLKTCRRCSWYAFHLRLCSLVHLR